MVKMATQETNQATLTDVERARLTRISAGFMNKLCLGGALALKGTGITLEKTTGFVGGALHLAGNAVEKTGEVTSTACYTGSKILEDKAQEYDISDLTDEQLLEFIKEQDEATAKEAVA